VTARAIQKFISFLSAESHSAQISWIKGHAGVPGNEKADVLAGQEAVKVVLSPAVSLTFLKLRISERYNKAKIWNDNPNHRGKDAIDPPP
jgi:hypothetical protein